MAILLEYVHILLGLCAIVQRSKQPAISNKSTYQTYCIPQTYTHTRTDTHKQAHSEHELDLQISVVYHVRKHKLYRTEMHHMSNYGEDK